MHPDARGGGAAEMLLSSAAAFAVARDLHPVLAVNERRNRATSVYERIGWGRVGSGPADYVMPSGECPLVHYYIGPNRQTAVRRKAK